MTDPCEVEGFIVLDKWQGAWTYRNGMWWRCDAIYHVLKREDINNRTRWQLPERRNVDTGEAQA